MVSKRSRGASWEYIVKRKELLHKPVSMTFQNEAKGEEDVAHCEKLLDAGIGPQEFAAKSKYAITTIEQYQEAVHITADEVQILNALVAGKRILLTNGRNRGSKNYSQKAVRRPELG